ncbi:MAG TPA: hypothetical protein VMW08_06645 [Acidimicrobiales bacterium]|nr:hypothetical protein [Acidimicrobiales bacterium]
MSSGTDPVIAEVSDPATGSTRATAESGATPSRWSTPALTVVCVAAYVAVQFRYLRPPMTEDAMTYIEAATAFPDLANDHWSLRIGLLLPLRVLLEAFGPSEVAYYAIPVAAGAALAGSTFLVGAALFGRSVGIASVIVLVSSNWFLSYSSALLPDHVAAALVTTAAAVMLSTRPSSRRAGLALLCIGGLLGWAYLVREFTLLLFPPAYLFIRSQFGASGVRRAALPVVVVFVAELVLNTAIHRNPLARWFVAGGHDEVVDRIEAPGSRLDAITRFPDAVFGGAGTFGIGLLLVLSLFSCVVLGRHRAFLCGWIGAYLVPLTLASGLVSPDLKLFRSQLLRYWTPVLPAIIVGGLGVLAVVARAICEAGGLRPRAAVRVGGVVVLLIAVFAAVRADEGVAAADIYERNGATQLDELRAWLVTEGADVEVLWTDSQTARVMPLVVRSAAGELLWDGEVRAFNSAEDPLAFAPPASFEPGQVIVFYPFGYLGRIDSWSAIPAHIRQLQPGWESVLQRRDDTLLIYRIG